MLVVLFVLMPASVASAHDPIILTAEQTTPARDRLLVDGTIFFALYGSLEGPTDTRGFRVQFQQEDPMSLSILIPDMQEGEATELPLGLLELTSNATNSGED